MLIPCSRSAHDQNVLARRPQWDQHGCHSKRERSMFTPTRSAKKLVKSLG